MIVRAVDDPAALATAWDELADRVRAVPWLHRSWVEAHVRAFGSGPLRTLTAQRDGRLAAILPLRWRGRAVRSPTNWHTPQFGVLCEDDGARDALLAELFARRPRSVALHLLDRESREVDAGARAARAAGYRIATDVQLRSPYVPVTGTLDDYLRAQREGRKLMKELRRQRRRLERSGAVALRVERGGERLDELLEVAWRLEGSGWKAARGTAIGSDRRTLAFYGEVARWAAARGTLRLAFLDVGDRPVAFDMLIEEHGRLYDLKGGYDVAYRPYGPGKILLSELLTLAFEHSLESLELLGAADPYKLQWTSSTRERIALRAFAPSVGGRAEMLAVTRARPLAAAALRALRARAVRARSGQPDLDYGSARAPRGRTDRR